MGKEVYLGGGIFKRFNQRKKLWFFYARYTQPDGTRRKECAGTTEKQAVRLRKLREGEIVAGTYISPSERPQELQGPTFGHFVDRFLREYVEGRCQSDHYEMNLTPAVKRFGSRPIESITLTDLESYQRAMKLDGLGDSTIRKRLMVLGTLFKRAVRWEVLQHSPAVGLEKPPEPPGDPRPLSKEQYAMLRDNASPEYRSLYRLAVVTSSRLKELCGLRWDDIDREAGLIHFSSDNKTRRPKVIPIGTVAAEVLDNQIRHVRSPYLFTDSTGEPYISPRRRSCISVETGRLMKKLGIPGSFKTLRVTSASWAGMAGESALAIKQLLGHAARDVAERHYLRFSPDYLRTLVSALDAAELSACGPQSAPNSISGVDAPKAKVVNSTPASSSDSSPSSSLA